MNRNVSASMKSTKRKLPFEEHQARVSSRKKSHKPRRGKRHWAQYDNATEDQ